MSEVDTIWLFLLIINLDLHEIEGLFSHIDKNIHHIISVSDNN